MKKIILIIIFIGLIIGWIIHNEQIKKREQNFNENLKNTTEKINNISNKYNATKYLDRENDTLLSLTQQLVTGKAIQFTGEIDDIFVSNDIHYIKIIPRVLFDDNKIIELRCNKDLSDSVSNSLSDNDNRFVIIANIKEILPKNNEDSNLLNQDDYSDYFTLKGDCIDIIPY